MEPVQHIAQWYAEQILKLQPKPLEPSWLYQALKSYEKLANGRSSLRDELAADKLLEAEQIDLEEYLARFADEQPEPTPLQHFIDRTEGRS